MTSDRALPEPVRRTLEEFQTGFGLDLHLWLREGDGGLVHCYPEEGNEPSDLDPGSVVRALETRDGPAFELEIRPPLMELSAVTADVLRGTLDQAFEFAQEVSFFTHEVSVRYEEINLLYTISETLGSVLGLEEAARIILHEVCDVMAAWRGSLWVYRPEQSMLSLVASVGEGGIDGPIRADDPKAVTAQVFREGQAMIVTREDESAEWELDVAGVAAGSDTDESALSVPIRYTPPKGQARTVGVINLLGRKRGGRFSASDQKLLTAIASQIGAALENNRLIRESLAQERVTREMELAHNLQMKLLPSAEAFDVADLGARVQPAESVGGDFYHFLKLTGGRMGIMIGDVSSHGFPAALIMALAMSAASIYASEGSTPGRVLRRLDDALREELESTEMYLTLFYAVVDPERGELRYSNAGHPHAFLVRGDGTSERLVATDPPVGIAGPSAYDQRVVNIETARDLLFLFTDGLSDALGGVAGERILVDKVVEMRGRSSSEIVRTLFEIANESPSPVPSDDRTAIVLRA